MGNTAVFRASFGVRFAITVDTEEGFDWDRPFSRVEHTLTAVPALHEGQRFFEESGVVPLYFADYPIVESAEAQDALGPAVQAARADIGTHLHPWVTPPFAERVNSHNSYAGNLPPEIEEAKLKTVTDAIKNRFGVQPRAYRAGRYGIGPNTPGLLSRFGYICDSSIRPLFDYRDDGGPDFREAAITPHWVDGVDNLLEVPLTSTYVGWAGRGRRLKLAKALEDFPVFRPLIARTGMLYRIALTPEGMPAALACRAIDALIADGVRLLVISFHSPSLAPGHTPYVQNAKDLERFYAWFSTVFDHCTKRGIAPASLSEILAGVEPHSTAAA